MFDRAIGFSQDPCEDKESWCKYEPNCEKEAVKNACPQGCGVCGQSMYNYIILNIP